MSITFFDKHGKQVPEPPEGTSATAGEGAFRYWLLSELEALRNKRRAIEIERAFDRAGAFTPEKTCELTGIPPARLSKKGAAKALGLELVRVARL
jgi:hypothetical protein